MTGSVEFRAHGLTLELATRRIHGSLVPGTPPHRGAAWLACLPAAVLSMLLVVPAGWTLVSATRARPGIVVWCAVCAVAVVALVRFVRRISAACEDRTPAGSGRRARSLPWVGTAGAGAVAAVAVFALGDALGRDGMWSYLRTLGWVVFGFGLLFVALLLAWWSRNARWLWRPLIVPFGISAFVSGVAFRLIFQYLADRLGIGSVLGYRLWFGIMLGSAFLWTWLGFLIGLFRAGIGAVQDDPVRWGYLRADDAPTLRRLYELLRPIVLVAGLVVGVAAARVFDVVLIGVPGSMHYQVDSATVHWWRLATERDPMSGEAAAYSLPLAVLVGLAAWVLRTGVRRHRVSLAPDPVEPVETPRAVAAGPVAGRVARTAGIALASAAALVPLIVLLVAAFRGPHGWSPAALTEIWRDEALRTSLQATAWVAALATIVVVAAAAPLAYRLAGLNPDHPLSGGIVTVLVVFAVLPVQSYLGPLDALIDAYGLSGTRIPLILVHAAAGLPIAVLILRGALLSPPDSSAADALRGPAPPGAITRRILTTAGPAIGAVAVLEFVQVWNDFVVGLLASGAGSSPWSLLLWGEARQFGENAAHLAAGSLVTAVLPVLLVLATWRRWLLPGLTGGALR
ncbi:hypothetical protein [Nocardia paucivorans]|uniref:hypothetical protein n=1 Tax=Nocardia paucivorans TaxID=114259 RepID=UPI00031800BD|nr:hypothetical protein [Nocardia paucivorans]